MKASALSWEEDSPTSLPATRPPGCTWPRPSVAWQITAWASDHSLASAAYGTWLASVVQLTTLTVPCLGQGLLFSTAEILRVPLDLVRLWLHEAERVYGDKMVDGKDQDVLRRVTMASTKKFFDVSQATKSL